MHFENCYTLLNIFFCWPKLHINIKRKKNPLPTKAQLSALGTRESNKSIKIRCTSDWKTTSAQAAVFFPAKLCVIWDGNKNIFYQPMIKPDVWGSFFKIKINFSRDTEGGLYEALIAIPEEYY